MAISDTTIALAAGRSGAVAEFNDSHGNRMHSARSNLTGQVEDFITLGGAQFWLFLIAERVGSVAMRRR